MGGLSDSDRLAQRTPPAERPVMRQVWRHLGFLHWPVAVSAIQPFLPPGLIVDTFDGTAYVGIVPFTISSSRVGPELPLVSPFHEVNLRTYVHHGGQAPGVWFFSLDAASRLAVLGARLGYHLPYFHARMHLQLAGDPAAPRVTYDSRRGKGEASFSAVYGPVGPPAASQPGTLEFFLLERYLLYAWNGGALSTARVHHAPYPVQTAVAERVQETLMSAAGLPLPEADAARVHYAHEVQVRIFRPHRRASVL